MTAPKSSFAAQLEKLGFEHWGDADMSEHDRTQLEAYGPLTFIRAPRFSPSLTFAFDELRHLWAAKGTIDLAPFGFTELFVDPEGTLQVPTRH